MTRPIAQFFGNGMDIWREIGDVVNLADKGKHATVPSRHPFAVPGGQHTGLRGDTLSIDKIAQLQTQHCPGHTQASVRL